MPTGIYSPNNVQENVNGLKKIVLKSFAALLIANTSCSGNGPQQASPAPTRLEQVVDEAIKHFSKEDFAAAQALLEQHLEYYGRDAGYRSLLAAVRACNGELDAARQTFEYLITVFENSPEIIIPVRDYLRPLFQTKTYQARKETLLLFARLHNDLYAVYGFLCLAERDFDNAYKAFNQALQNHPDKKDKYFALMERLELFHQNAFDTVGKEGYARIKKLFETQQQKSPD